ncbi:hypothetical protein BE04_39465 [Sorangium cellulosum]|uniref:Uncharacterized protein n=1 Tax=Sorangium cellulosum TaxID=56 RepID=A0A150PQS3_SORCE|nr:hypothetical protein BE04_39465 [Sorangium cellulosum]
MKLKMFEPWASCVRCARWRHRWGVFAPKMRMPTVVVLAAAASRASQAAERLDPALGRVVDEIRGRWGLAVDEVHGDVLLACGPSRPGAAHEVAACYQRLEDQVELGGNLPKLIVLLGHLTARLARLAGLFDAQAARLGGARVPAVVVSSTADIGTDGAWQVLGSPTAGPFQHNPYGTAAEALLWDLIHGRSHGHAWRDLDGSWRRFPGRRPARRNVAAHVAGAGWLSPFQPVGTWPYVVLDVDLHHAAQGVEFDATINQLRALFPSSKFYQSSDSGGVHVFVKLPEGTTYAEGAVTMAEYLAKKKLLIGSVPSRRSGRGDIFYRRVEVPAHPPRLPFGRGSAWLDGPSMNAVADFGNWLNNAPASDYSRAKQMTAKAGARIVKGRWTERAAWVRTYIHNLELAEFPRRRTAPVPPTDPWNRLLPKLAPVVRELVSTGCPAYGTRTAVMQRLADALAELVEPLIARELLRHWVADRDHRSEDIELDREAVLAAVDEFVGSAFADQGFVPETVWAIAEKNIDAFYKANAALPPSLTRDQCRRAAFNIMRLFYRRKHGVIPIAGERFGLALKKERAGDLPRRRPFKNHVARVRETLVRLDFLREVTPADRHGHRAAVYELLSPYWPPPTDPGEFLHVTP